MSTAPSSVPVPAPALSQEQRQRLIAARRAHWRRTRALTGALLLLWFCTTFGTVFYARQLAALSIFGWPMSFYMAAQGASLVYLSILGVYALAMRRIDRRFAASLDTPATALPARAAPPPHKSASAWPPVSEN